MQIAGQILPLVINVMYTLGSFKMSVMNVNIVPSTCYQNWQNSIKN